jgi:hypothetical protein
LRFIEIFWSDFRKYFGGVFELLMQRNGQKRDKQKSKEKTTGKFFPPLSFNFNGKTKKLIKKISYHGGQRCLI